MKESQTKDKEPSPPNENENENENKFPHGLRVLAVDDNTVCLMLLERLLRNCHYNVTLSREADATLELLKQDKDQFDIVITDVHMTEKRDGFKLLETIGLEMDIPVIMVSADDDKDLVLKAIQHGACDYLVKPVRLQEIKNIWQHVIRKTKTHGSKAVKREREEPVKEEFDLSEAIATKRPRFSWTRERHAKFIAIVNELGADNAAPSKILEKMGIPGLTRQQVASHLQKFRSGIKKSGSEISFGSRSIEEHVNNTHLTINKQGILQVGEQVHHPGYTNQFNNLVHLIPQKLRTLNRYNQVPTFGEGFPSCAYSDFRNPRTESILNNYPLFGSTPSNVQYSRDLEFLDPSRGELIPNSIPVDMGVIPRSSLFQVNEIFPVQTNRSSDVQYDIENIEQTFVLSGTIPSNSMEERHALDDDFEAEYFFQQNTTYSDGFDSNDINAIIDSTLQGMQ